ncbi:MAG: mannosyltransferase [Solirubrobacteraceae bacterium]|nr:mannosyltransferase [Solirubrobacteraceae bacterium]
MTATHPRTHRPPARGRPHTAPPPAGPPRRGHAPLPPAGPRRLAGEQLAVAGGQLTAGLGNLLFSLIAARVLAPGAFAELTAFLALYLLIHVPAASLSAGSALRPALAVHARRRVLLGGSLAGGTLALLSYPLGLALGLSPLLLLAAAASAPTAGLIALDRGRLYGLGRHGRAVGSLLAEPVVRLAVGVALAALAGPVGGAIAVVLAGWAALAVAHLPGTTPAGAPASAEGGAPAVAVVAFLLLAVVQNQDALLANALLPASEAGRFAVLSTLGGVAAFATTTVPLMLLPRAGAGRDALRVAVTVAGLLGFAAVLVVAVSPHALVGAIFGARYAPVGGVAVPYVLAMALLGVARVVVAHACAGETAAGSRAIPARALLGLLAGAAALQAALIATIGHDAAGVATATLIATTALTAGTIVLARAPAPAELLARARTLHRDVAIVAGFTVGGIVLRLLAWRGIWLDEATSIKQARMPFGAMLHDLGTTDVHPPLHYAVLWLTVRVFGYGEIAVRLPSLIAASALIPLLYVIGRDVYDRRAGLTAAGLATIAPFAVWYADEARMYAFFMLFALLAAWMQIRILRDGRARDCAAYVAAAVALIYTQYFGLLLIGAQQLVFAAALWSRRRDRAALRLGLVAWGAWLPLLVMALIPLMPFAIGQFDANEAAGKGFQVPSQTAGSLGTGEQPPGAYAALTNAVWALLGYHSDVTMTALAALWPLLMLLALLLLGRGRSWATATFATAAILPAVALFALGQIKPFVFEVRYFIGAVPLALLLIARAVTSWPRRRVPTVLATGVAALALLAGLADQQLNGSNPRVYDFKGALHALEAQARPGDVVVYSPPYLDAVVAYYGGGNLDARPLEKGLPEPSHGHRVFVLGSFLDKPQYRDATLKAVRTLDRRHTLVGTQKRPQIRIWEFR